ncbi:unnamed protein product [Ixodes persulcatus]
MFTFNAYDDRGVPHDESRILTQLIRVVEMSPEKDVGVGILTAEDRDVWAKVYASLDQNSQNAASLEAIKRASLVVCLDGGLEDVDPYEVAWPRQVYKGGPNAEYAANRWWDKPVQVIVGEDGGSALLYDHTTFDGSAMAGVTNHCCDYAYNKRTAYQISNIPLYPEFWSLKKYTKSNLYSFSSFGLYVTRCIGNPVMAYGAASTRQFLHGRADGFHSSSEDSLSFCKVFDNPLSSREEKEQSLRKAVERCKQEAVFAADGFGVQRMIYGLISIGLEDGVPIHPFFKNQVFWRPALIASQVNLQCDGTTLADPALPDIYMVMYNIRPESFTFGLSCSKSFPEKNVAKFKDALEKALTELRACVERSS